MLVMVVSAGACRILCSLTAYCPTLRWHRWCTWRSWLQGRRRSTAGEDIRGRPHEACVGSVSLTSALGVWPLQVLALWHVPDVRW